MDSESCFLDLLRHLSKICNGVIDFYQKRTISTNEGQKFHFRLTKDISSCSPNFSIFIIARMRITTIAINHSLQPRDMAVNWWSIQLNFVQRIYMKTEFGSQRVDILLVIAAMTSYANQESI